MGGFGCCLMLGIHALHYRRLSCAGDIVVFVGRMHCRLPVPAVFLVFGWAGVAVGMSVGVVAVVVCLWLGISGRYRLDSGSLSIGCVGFVVSGVGLCRSRLRDVNGKGGVL